MIVVRKILSSLGNCEVYGKNAKDLLIEIENERSKYKVYDHQSNETFGPMPTDMVILQFQQLFKRYSQSGIHSSLLRLRESRIESEKVFDTLKELSLNSFLF